ncbi:DUF4397 domain-containing protein [Kangiella sp. TOML190]|uniref:DUF4397 domain-containing protein n=1 Tax=Kangiella sp. TOML190 TaxID=2931351 RepID=UPI002040B944|nr:DUF4397 domain-containing protein [Kangiella sp. TOML190]
MSIKKLLLLFTSMLLFVGCDDDDDSFALIPPTPKTTIQVVHASQDSPLVNVQVNASTAISELDFAKASERIELDAATYSIQVDGLTPSGPVAVIGPVDLDLAANQLYTVVALDETANIEPIILTQSEAAPAAGQFTLQVLHAASNAPTVDIYLTAPGEDISSLVPTVTLAFKDSLSPTDIAAGDYQIRITATGAKDVVYDSGALTLTEGALLNLVAVTNTGPGTSPVNLLALSADGAATLYDAAKATDLRVFHLSPDAPAVDVVANDDFANPLLTNVAFPEFSDYLTLAADDYNVKVVPTGASTPAVIDADVSLTTGISYSVLAVNTLANIEPLILEDNRRSISTESQLRIIHGSPSAGLVDLYLVPPATDISMVDPNFSGVDFKQDTGYLSLAAGDYDVIVTAQGSKTPAIGPAAITLENNNIYTVIARDNVGGGVPLGVVLADDFAN